MHSLQLIFSKNWVRWSQKVYPEPEILWVASAWSESKLLRNMIWWIRVATNLFWAKFTSETFIFKNYKIKSSSMMRNTYQSHMHEAYKETILLYAAYVVLSFVKFCVLCEFLFILSWSKITYTPPPHAKTSTLEE